jgi:hypothetical protein
MGPQNDGGSQLRFDCILIFEKGVLLLVDLDRSVTIGNDSGRD